MKTSIIVWPFRKSDKWYRTLVSNLICFFTNSNYTHVAISHDGFMYESTVMNSQNGAMKTIGLPSVHRGCLFFELKTPLTDEQAKKLKLNLDEMVVQRRPYNFMKIAVLALIYPTRKFWNWLGWVPFQNEVFGYICSVFVDVAFKDIGIDLFKSAFEEYTAPGDFVSNPMLVRII